MKQETKSRSGIQSLLAKYRTAVRALQNLHHGSSEDSRNAERKFLKYALEQRRIEIEEELYR